MPSNKKSMVNSTQSLEVATFNDLNFVDEYKAPNENTLESTTKATGTGS